MVVVAAVLVVVVVVCLCVCYKRVLFNFQSAARYPSCGKAVLCTTQDVVKEEITNQMLDSSRPLAI